VSIVKDFTWSINCCVTPSCSSPPPPPPGFGICWFEFWLFLLLSLLLETLRRSHEDQSIAGTSSHDSLLLSLVFFSGCQVSFHVMYQAFLRPSTDHAYPAHLSWIKSEMRWSQLHCCMVVNLDRTDKLTWDRINLRSKPIRVEKKNLINLVKHSG